VVQVSVIDFGVPHHTLELAPVAEACGYFRYWLGEHHSPGQASNPLLLASLVAGVTETIRVGIAGVCLPYHSPFQVAEDARFLAEVYPDRMDLGAVKGMVFQQPAMAAAILDGRELRREVFDDRFELLCRLLLGTLPPDHPLAAVAFGCSTSSPELWMLGLTPENAELAGRLGVNFCFSEHHNRLNTGGKWEAAPAIRRYREVIARHPAPYGTRANVVLSGVCAPSEREAREHAARAPRRMPPSYLGDPALCAEQIEGFCRRAGVDEAVLLDDVVRGKSTLREDLARREWILRNQAQAFGLVGAGAEQPQA
jgi:luciferase family oxidoreductase group 1